MVKNHQTFRIYYSYNGLKNHQIIRKREMNIIHIINATLGSENDEVDNLYEELHQILRKEYGRFSLGQSYESDKIAIHNFFLNESDCESCLDIIELFFKENSYDFPGILSLIFFSTLFLKSVFKMR